MEEKIYDLLKEISAEVHKISCRLDGLEAGTIYNSEAIRELNGAVSNLVEGLEHTVVEVTVRHNTKPKETV